MRLLQGGELRSCSIHVMVSACTASRRLDHTEHMQNLSEKTGIADPHEDQPPVTANTAQGKSGKVEPREMEMEPSTQHPSSQLQTEDAGRDLRGCSSMKPQLQATSRGTSIQAQRKATLERGAQSRGKAHAAVSAGADTGLRTTN